MARLIYTLMVSALIGGTCFGSDSKPEKLPPSHFTFNESVKLFPSPKVPGLGATWLSLVHMKGVKGFPFDYALFFATDHHPTGGIWMYVCKGVPSDPKGWKSYDQAVADGDFDHLSKKPEKNPIFLDKTQGRSTETPHALVIDDVVYLTYHNAGAGRSQSTLLATSPDGVNFTRIHGKDNSVVLDYSGGPGNGHTGYFRWGVNRFSGVDFKYVGYSLHGGGDGYHMAMWVSNDAVKWQRLKVLKSLEGVADDGLIINWHGINPDSIRMIEPGQYVAICAASTRASGTAKRRGGWYEIFLGPDGVTLTRKPRLIPALETSVVIDETWHWASLSPDRKWFMGAKGSFTADAAKTPEMDKEDQRRHFWTK